MTPATENARESCREIRRNILRASHASGNGHIPTSFSIVELLWAVYWFMRHDPRRPDWPERDLFLLSKGHGSLGLYCVLARLGYFPEQEVHTFGAHGSRFGCHPDRRKVPGVEASTGSLGHGIGLAVGMALAFRLQDVSRRAYVLIGDGESNEGTVWEALQVAAYQRLSNMTVLFDGNRSQTRSLPIENASEKFRAFGCEVVEVDGHDVAEIRRALQLPQDTIKVVVARTVKGFGCKTLVDGVFEWHRKAPNDEQLQALLRELDA